MPFIARGYLLIAFIAVDSLSANFELVCDGTGYCVDSNWLVVLTQCLSLDLFELKIDGFSLTHWDKQSYHNCISSGIKFQIAL